MFGDWRDGQKAWERNVDKAAEHAGEVAEVFGESVIGQDLAQALAWLAKRGRMLGGVAEVAIGVVIFVVGVVVSIGTLGAGLPFLLAGAALILHGLDTSYAGYRDLMDPGDKPHQTFVADNVARLLQGWFGVEQETAKEIGEFVDFVYPLFASLPMSAALSACAAQLAALERVIVGGFTVGGFVRIRLADGWKEVEGVADGGAVETVYNLRVADFHTYFVGGEEWGWSLWAHNLKYNTTIGARGEAVAKAAYLAAGFTFVGSLENKSGHGLDLILRKPWEPGQTKGDLFISEVKSSKNTSGKKLSERQAKLGAAGYARQQLTRAISGTKGFSRLKATSLTPIQAKQLLKELNTSGIRGKRITITNVYKPTKIKVTRTGRWI